MTKPERDTLIWDIYARVDAAYIAGDMHAALVGADELVRLFPRDPLGYSACTRYRVETNELEAAETIAIEGLQKAGPNRWILHWLAEAAMKGGDLAKAEARWLRLTELFPLHEPAYPRYLDCQIAQNKTLSIPPHRDQESTSPQARTDKMDIRMSSPEKALLTGHLMNARRYLEFGSGGSTCLASSLVAESIISTDSSREWQDRVREECAAKQYPIEPTLLYVDIGETGEWGWPIDASTRHKWPNYHTAVWENPLSKESDFFLVDGRFRVACFMQITLHAQPNALIAIHDFAGRPAYQIVREVAQEIEAAETLSIFKVRGDYDPTRASALLKEYTFQPD